MKRIFIGHRGVGKTSLLKRHLQYFSEIPHFDLDFEIEKKTQMSIADYFAKFSEDQFRKIEFETYQEILKNNRDYVIALGAGFPVAAIDSMDEVIYVSRVTDADGRIFLNRPRLNPEISPLEESKKRFQQRDSIFRARADFIYHLSEGVQAANPTEKRILSFRFKIEDAYYTLASNEVGQIKKRMQNFSKIELRTDLLPQAEILRIVHEYPNHHWLVSHRQQQVFVLPDFVEVDCDVRFFKNQKVQILSTHADSISQALQEIKPYQSQFHIKLCPAIESFKDLKMGFDWQQESPSTRSFLPRSANGRWNWFRHLLKYVQKINFVRNFNEQMDQASITQWLDLPALRPEKWAAVVGKPVYFSRSPARHADFFQNKSSFMCAVQLDPQEFRSELGWLHQLGLAYLAITSPLKETAFQLSTQLTDEARELKSVNTIFMTQDQVMGHNTDLDGFKSLQLPDSKSVAVWGGGGTLQMMKKVLTKAIYFSSQTGLVRDPQPDKASYSILVWAAPRSEQTKFPPWDWPLTDIVDLNYVENSMGLEYAQKVISNGKNIKYVSGLQMFDEQARQQQEFWSST